MNFTEKNVPNERKYRIMPTFLDKRASPFLKKLVLFTEQCSNDQQIFGQALEKQYIEIFG